MLVGDNNIGKSAVRRAIEGVFSNLSGRNFVTWWKDNAFVELEFKDHKKISWQKGKDGTRYRVDGKLLDSPGKEVPPEVANLGFSVIKLMSGQKINVNFSGLLNPLFLLDLSGPVVAEVISTATRLNQIGYANKLCNTDTKSSKSTLKIREDDLKKIEFKLTTWSDIPGLVTKNSGLQKSQGLLSVLEADKVYLEMTIDSLEQINNKVKELSVVSSLAVPEDNFSDLQTMLDELDEYESELEQRQQNIAALSKIDVTLPTFETQNLVEEVLELEGWIESLATLQENLSSIEEANNFEVPSVDFQSQLDDVISFDELVTTLDKQCKVVYDLQKELKDIESKQSVIAQEFEALGITTCPICDGPLPTL